MAEPVRARRLSDHEGQTLAQIVRRGRGTSIRVRRATMIMASASGTPVSAIARLVAADEDTVRDVIHAFNERGLAALDPQWAGGRPRRISDDDIAFIVTTATTRPAALGVPFTHWSLRKLTAHLAERRVRVGRERLRQILREAEVSFQRTRTWKESTDPDKDTKLDRIEYVTSHYLNRCFAFDRRGDVTPRDRAQIVLHHRHGRPHGGLYRCPSSRLLQVPMTVSGRSSPGGEGRPHRPPSPRTSASCRGGGLARSPKPRTAVT